MNTPTENVKHVNNLGWADNLNLHLQSEKLDHSKSIEFEFEAILSVQTVFILKSIYYTIMLLGAYTVYYYYYIKF